MSRLNTITLSAALLVAAGGCASSGPKSPDQNPKIVAAVNAAPRIVAGETTWVTRGPGYDIVAFSRRDIAAFDSAMARASNVFTQTLGAVPTRVVVSVYRVAMQVEAGGYARRPLLPPDELAPVVDAPIFDPSTGTAGTTGASRAMRAWLSARASAITGRAGTQGSTGLIDDPRLPSWAEALVPALAVSDTAVIRLAVALSAADVPVIPLVQFFAMERPQPEYADGSGDGPRGGNGGNDGGQRGGARGGGGGGGFGGGGAGGGGGGGGGYGGGGMGGGGFGGRGGMGGGGRGGMRGSGGGGGRTSNASHAKLPLRGAQLYEAEATVLGRYLTVREGAPFIGQLVDAQLRGDTVDSVLALQTIGPTTLSQLDADWRQWLAARAESSPTH